MIDDVDVSMKFHEFQAHVKSMGDIERLFVETHVHHIL